MASDIQTVVDAFAALPAQLPSVLEFEHGVNESPEHLNDGFTHVFVLTFATREAFETAYLHEPAHQAFVGTLSGVLARALVVDFKSPTGKTGLLPQ